MDSLLNYPLYGILAQVFTDGHSMSRLNKYHESAAIGWKDKTVLGNFVDNHDLSRYLSHTPDMANYKAFYAYVLATVGIPMVYYGDEQCFTGGDDPANREPLWGKMNTDSEMYQFFKTIIEFKKKSGYHSYEQIERFADESLYAFSRGENFFAFSNSEEMQTRRITNHPYEEGGYLCDVFNQKDCVQVRNGEFQVTLIGKQAKFLRPQPNPETETLRNRAWKNLKKIWSNLFTSDASKITTISNSGIKR
jgi:alpha-amylase